ncbi:hypothetical protein [Conexibacter woesei]|uniref:Uncharacterized protein n=1 Tax=Conexibacter woesei (strain DSM 14684 / CCUG 47730 / CIP 108061 / JCM 11494 / NBRC 100937 / ID131577) TaxID=469383 RepID=D3F021_CONWI|nr:hypothetical protein [Conexibacter woesei]ADB49997.1 hypothetical protein Cwoe_1569 [Conexibacter woesei DSM 14684]
MTAARRPVRTADHVPHAARRPLPAGGGAPASRTLLPAGGAPLAHTLLAAGGGAPASHG